MDKIDKQLLDIIQSRFPIEKRPFQILAKKLNLTEEKVISHLEKLKKEGIIRRLGAIFNSKSLGYVSTLLAMKVPFSKIEEVAGIVNTYSGVTHNYLRDYEFNLWFTLTSPSEEELKETIEEIKTKTGLSEPLLLPAVKLFKIRAEFNLIDSSVKSNLKIKSLDAECQKSLVEEKSYMFTDDEKKLIRMLQEDLPLVTQPFKVIAGEVGLTEEEVIAKIQEWAKKGTIRRFGAILRHREAGFRENAMVVWRVPAKHVEKVGKIMATFKEVSHCYERLTYPGWPYNLFTMIHGRTKEECEEVARKISKATDTKDFKLLYSTREFKKVSMKYFVERK